MSRFDEYAPRVCVSVVWRKANQNIRNQRWHKCDTLTHATTNNSKHFQLHSCGSCAGHCFIPCRIYSSLFNVHSFIHSFGNKTYTTVWVAPAHPLRVICIVIKTKAIENNCQHSTWQMPIRERQQRAHRLCCVINRICAFHAENERKKKKQSKIMSNFQRWYVG